MNEQERSYRANKHRMSYSTCKWGDRLNPIFEEGLDNVRISIEETGHESVQSMRNACAAALKRLGKGNMYQVSPSSRGIIISRNY